MNNTTITFKELIKRALCIDNKSEHKWSHKHEGNRDLAWVFPVDSIHCLKCGTYLYRYWIALHIINNETMDINEYPSWNGEHKVYDPKKPDEAQ